MGVDVFFVISGYLITSHLLRSGLSAQGIRLGSFYARRMRRLLPASLLTLAVTGLGAWYALTDTQWIAVWRDMIASAFYVGNWSLAMGAVDYFAVDSVNPVQQFWSLSVEEQFYIVWPLLIILSLWMARRAKSEVSPRLASLAVLGTVAFASFAVSVWWTAREPGTAYFATPTRAWEFAAGGLLALLPERRQQRIAAHAISPLLSWVGLAMIGYALFTYYSAMPFPGTAALLPVIGTVLVLLGGTSEKRFSPAEFYRLTPVQWLGGVSYSLYLWHWPLLILGPIILRRWGADSLARPIFLVAFALVVAWASKRFVEDPFITGSLGKRLAQTTPRTVLAAAAAMLVASAVILAPQTPLLAHTVADTKARDALIAQIESGADCIGGEVLGNPDCGSVSMSDIVPSTRIANRDRRVDECQQTQTRWEPLTCTFGVAGGTPVALVGDSHMTQWLSAFEDLAEERGWEITTYLRSGCPLVDTENPYLRASPLCTTWGANVLADIATKSFDTVFLTARNRYVNVTDDAEIDLMAGSMGAAAEKLTAAGSRVVVIADTPVPQEVGIGDVPSCIEEASVGDCALPRGAALPAGRNPLQRMAEDQQLPYVDFTDLLCGESSCPVVIGGVLVYRDDSHLSDTYVHSISKAVAERLAPVLDGQ